MNRDERVPWYKGDNQRQLVLLTCVIWGAYLKIYDDCFFGKVVLQSLVHVCDYMLQIS